MRHAHEKQAGASKCAAPELAFFLCRRLASCKKVDAKNTHTHNACGAKFALANFAIPKPTRKYSDETEK